MALLYDTMLRFYTVFDFLNLSRVPQWRKSVFSGFRRDSTDRGIDLAKEFIWPEELYTHYSCFDLWN